MRLEVSAAVCAARPLAGALFLALVLSLSAATAPPASGLEKVSLMKVGMEYYGRGAYPEARACFENLVRRHPDSWQARYQLGNTYLALNQPDLAEKQYVQALINAPDAQCQNICREALASVARVREGAKPASLPGGPRAGSKPPGKNMAVREAPKPTPAAEKNKKKQPEEIKEEDSGSLLSKREEILAATRERVMAIQAQARARLRKLSEGGGFTESGSSEQQKKKEDKLDTGVPDHIADQILEEARARIDQVEAEAREKLNKLDGE